MLVITRTPGQSFGVGDNIVIRVVSVCGNSVRLGIEAPQEIRVVRDDAIRKTPRTFAAEADQIPTPDQRVPFPPEEENVA